MEAVSSCWFAWSHILGIGPHKGTFLSGPGNDCPPHSQAINPKQLNVAVDRSSRDAGLDPESTVASMSTPQQAVRMQKALQ